LSGATAVRAALVAAGVALAVVGVRREQGHDACSAARADVFAIVLKRAPADGAPAVARRVAADCRDTTTLSESSVALLRVRQTTPARELAQTATRREPDVRNGWLALSLARRQAGDRAGADRALQRARQLDPVGLAAR
jgi:Flp pilus assembly protein TadD